jgi:ribosome-associated toxin RatA of RatAB toxin-antitoxin module
MTLGPMPASARSRTLDVLFVRAPQAIIFGLAADVRRWPQHLPHYRYVRFREHAAGAVVVEMSASRMFGPLPWPTWWTSVMEIHRGSAPAIRFRHVEGITTRMEVQWTFAEEAGGTRVAIEHLWDGPRWPMIGAFAARAVIGPLFVHGIASQTLAGLARIAEQHHTSP